MTAGRRNRQHLAEVSGVGSGLSRRTCVRVGLLGVTVWMLLGSVGNTALADDVCGNAGVICYVDKNSQSCCTGSGCAGTESAPFCTIKEGLATVVDGGTVRVNDGAYNED